MTLSTSVLRRYTPPTCTLEIVAPSSPLSRWAGRTVATQLRFHLHFDDPRLSEEQRIHITGDRAQLEALQQVVAAYVQDLINQSPEQFNAQLTSQATPSDSKAVSTAPAAQIIEISPVSSEESPKSPDFSTQQISLKPSTGLTHSLVLGSLATPATGFAIQLSVLQLFDLATALDEYATDVITLPLNRRRFAATTPPAWASIAAVLTLAVGATVVLQQLNRPNSPQQAAINNDPTLTDPQAQIAAQPSPLPTLSPLETLPPPPPAGSTVPIPNTTLAPIPVPNSLPASPTAPTASAPTTTTAPQQQQQLAINPESQRRTSTPRQAAPNQTTSSSQPGSATSVPVIPIPSPLAQLNSPNPGSQAAISQALRNSAPAAGTTAVPQQQAANTNTAVRSPSAPTPPEPASLDNINQVAEARQFFQQRWEPTAGVRQTLEYSLLLDVDGTIQRIEPLGQAAREQVDRTGMPLIGEPFVSPIRDGRVARIRVVLSPDGKVQTFLESREEPSNANAARQQPQ